MRVSGTSASARASANIAGHTRSGALKPSRGWRDMWHIVVLAPNRPAWGCASAPAVSVRPVLAPGAVKSKGAVRADANPSNIMTQAIAAVQRPIFEHDSKRFIGTLREEMGAVTFPM
jgi:hypothetical protein